MERSSTLTGLWAQTLSDWCSRDACCERTLGDLSHPLPSLQLTDLLFWPLVCRTAVPSDDWPLLVTCNQSDRAVGGSEAHRGRKSVIWWLEIQLWGSFLDCEKLLQRPNLWCCTLPPGLPSCSTAYWRWHLVVNFSMSGSVCSGMSDRFKRFYTSWTLFNESSWIHQIFRLIGRSFCSRECGKLPQTGREQRATQHGHQTDEFWKASDSISFYCFPLCSLRGLMWSTRLWSTSAAKQRGSVMPHLCEITLNDDINVTVFNNKKNHCFPSDIPQNHKCWHQITAEQRVTNRAGGVYS